MGDYEMVRDPHISRLIAERLAEMHVLLTKHVKQQFSESGTLNESGEGSNSQGLQVFKANPAVPFLELGIHRFLSAIPARFSDANKQRRFEELAREGVLPPTRDALAHEVDEMLAYWRSLNVELVFAHNDLLLANIVYNKDQGKPAQISLFVKNTNQGFIYYLPPWA